MPVRASAPTCWRAGASLGPRDVEAKSAPRRTRTPITAGTSSRSSDSFTRSPWAARPGRGALEPLVDRLPTRTRSRGQFAGQLERPLAVSTSITIQPATRSLVSANGPSVTGAAPRHRSGRTCPPGRAPERRRTRRCPGAERRSHPCTACGRKLLRRPLLHRHVVDRCRRAQVVLEQQVLGHHVSPWCGRAHCGPCLLRDGAAGGFSTSHRDISRRTSQTPRTAVGLRLGRSTQCERPRAAQPR